MTVSAYGEALLSVLQCQSKMVVCVQVHMLLKFAYMRRFGAAAGEREQHGEAWGHLAGGAQEGCGGALEWGHSPLLGTLTHSAALTYSLTFSLQLCPSFPHMTCR